MANNTSRKKIRLAMSRREALRLRLEGHDYAEIGRQMKISGTQACRFVKHELDRIRKHSSELAEEARDLEVTRLDGYLLALQLRVKIGCDKAIETAMKISKRRSDLLGLDAPKKKEVTGEGGGPIEVKNYLELVKELTKLEEKEEEIS